MQNAEPASPKEDAPVQPPPLPPDFPEVAQNPNSDLQPPPPPAARPDEAAGGRSRPSEDELSDQLRRLERQADQLKARIEEQRRAHDMPIDSNLGNPEWQEKAADGRFDLPDDEEN